MVRQYPRYDISHSDHVGGSLSEADNSLRLVSLSKGGCGFVATELVDGIAPPQEVICSIYERDGLDFKRAEIVLGNLVYIRPVSGASYSYGVRFHEPERKKLESFIERLEELSALGDLEKSWAPPKLP